MRKILMMLFWLFNLCCVSAQNKYVLEFDNVEDRGDYVTEWYNNGNITIDFSSNKIITDKSTYGINDVVLYLDKIVIESENKICFYMEKGPFSGEFNEINVYYDDSYYSNVSYYNSCKNPSLLKKMYDNTYVQLVVGSFLKFRPNNIVSQALNMSTVDMKAYLNKLSAGQRFSCLEHIESELRNGNLSQKEKYRLMRDILRASDPYLRKSEL